MRFLSPHYWTHTGMSPQLVWEKDYPKWMIRWPAVDQLVSMPSSWWSAATQQLTWYGTDSIPDTNWGGSNMTVFVQLLWSPWAKYLLVSVLFWHRDLLEHLLSTLHHPHRGSLLVTQLLQLVELEHISRGNLTTWQQSRELARVSGVRVSHLVTYCSIHIVYCWWPAESSNRRRYWHGVE